MKMLRWFKKKSSKNDQGKSNSVITHRDEYGFDPVRKCSSSNVLFVRNEHIYEEISDVPPREEKKVLIPDLPPRNSTRRPKKTGRSSYSQWRSATLSQKSRSLPELQHTAETGITVADVHQQKKRESSRRRQKHSVERSSLTDAHSVILPKQAHIRVLRKSNDVSFADSLDDFNGDRSTSYPRSDYLPHGSDSGYDYSGTSSNGSDVNDSGIASSYEFHLSKAEQLRRMEQEVQDLVVSPVQLASRGPENRSGKCHKRNYRKKDSGTSRDLSMASSSSRTSVTSDLDMDDETLAYDERSDVTFFEKFTDFENDFLSNRLSVRAMPLSKQQSSTNVSSMSSRSGGVSSRLDRHSIHTQSTRSATTKEVPGSSSKGRECRNVKCKNKHLNLSPQKSASIGRCSGQAMVGDVTQRYQRPSNRLLGDLIRRNNDTLFMV